MGTSHQGPGIAAAARAGGEDRKEDEEDPGGELQHTQDRAAGSTKRDARRDPQQEDRERA